MRTARPWTRGARHRGDRRHLFDTLCFQCACISVRGAPRGPGQASQSSPSSSDETTAGATHSNPQPWRTFLSMETIEAIDVLTFTLGQYLEQRRAPSLRQLTTFPEKHGANTSEGKRSTATATSAGARSRRARSNTRDKFVSLDALSTKRRPPISATFNDVTADTMNASMHHRCRDVPTTQVHPFTPFHQMEALIRNALREEKEREEGDGSRMGGHSILKSDGDGAGEMPSRGREGSAMYGSKNADGAQAWARVTTHPPNIFHDEAAVLYMFGMGGSTSPSAPGFDGLFRQRWQDFYVTEMVPDATSTTGGSVVSRDFSYAIPPLPCDLLKEVGGAGSVDSRTHSGASCRRELEEEGTQEDGEGVEDGEGSDEEGPNASFFDVDVAAQLAEIAKADVAKVAAKAAHGTALPSNESTEYTSAAAKKTHEDIPTSAKPTPHDRSAYLKALDEREAALMRAETDSRHHHHSHGARFYLQCTLHKQHVAHSAALASIAQTLRVHPRAISVAGIKDFIGDTVQRIRIENVSPVSVLRANAIMARRSSSSSKTGEGGRHSAITLSDFSYESAPLSPGDLFGNHFRITLRDVTASKAHVRAALEAFRSRGFPNYYGCQRFSWFAGKEDAAFGLLRHNWLAFAFRFLNFTRRDRSLRELLQRERRYPHPVQDEYRRNIVRRLRQVAVEPVDLDEPPFLSCPPLTETSVTGAGGGPLNARQELILWQLREAYFDLHSESRRLTAQRLSSYLWNQVLTLRLHHFGGRAVLDGDHVTSAELRRAACTVWDRKALHQLSMETIHAGNRDRYTIADVVHPGFSFEGIRLPDNPVGVFYTQVCEKYRLDWQARHTRSGIADFCEPPRPIVRHPMNLSYEHNEAARKLTVQFALERGCYANVAITELMKLTRCAGSETVTVLPLASDALWDAMGVRDPGYVTALQDVYEGYEDGLGFTQDSVNIDLEAGSTPRVWDLPGPLFLPEEEDPFRKAHKWGSRNLLRNSERRQSDRAAAQRRLFEAPLAARMQEQELDRYAGHTVPFAPNAKGKRIFFKVLRRNSRYAGAPRTTPSVRRVVQKPNRSHKLPAFQTLNKNSWNVSW